MLSLGQFAEVRRNLRLALSPSPRSVYPHQQTPFRRHAVTEKECHGTKALRASLLQAGNVGWQIGGE